MNTVRYNMMVSAVHDDPPDLPGLTCGACGLLASFGGRETFDAGVYTVEDVCHCNSVNDCFRFLFVNPDVQGKDTWEEHAEG